MGVSFAWWLNRAEVSRAWRVSATPGSYFRRNYSYFPMHFTVGVALPVRFALRRVRLWSGLGLGAAHPDDHGTAERTLHPILASSVTIR